MASASSNGGRTFVDKPAVRERVPLLIGLVGASGSGKTFSALRLAAGIQKVADGPVFVIDTEARRSLHYASLFKFRHVEFGAPFSPLDYLAAIEHCVRQGAKTIVVDSASHEHEGPGGVLEMHTAEVERLSKAWGVSADKANIPAWAGPKQKRRQLLNALLQMSCNFIFCFRAKEKLKIVPGKNPQPLGWMPIAGEEFVYEMALNCLLYPGSGGVPSWHPEEMGEKAMVKLPEQFKDLFSDRKPLSEETGQKLAEWAAGGGTAKSPEPEAVMVANVSERSMKSDQRGPVLFTVRAADGREFGTFDGALADVARNSAELGVPVLVTFTKSPKGGLALTSLVHAAESETEPATETESAAA